MVSRAAFVSIVILSAAAASAQIKLPGGNRLPDLKIPGLDNILKGEDPLTTTIKDIKLLGWPELDRVKLINPRALGESDRTETGVFKLKPGSYTAELQSFCTKGYTYGPTQGMGYVIGDWKGSKAAFLQTLIRAYGQKGGVDQRDVQLLIWSVLARVKPQNFSPEAKRALAHLMGEDSAKLLAEGALDYLNESTMKEVSRRLSPALRPFFEADNKMRGLFAKAGTSYQEIERLGVLQATEELKTSVPRGRWNLSPQGYLVRYFPAGYNQVRTEIIVPHNPQIEKDSKGRLTQLKIADFTLQITYDEARRSAPYPSDPGVVAHPVSKVRIEVPEARGGVVEKTSSTAWVFVGAPKRSEHAASQNSLLLRLITRAPFQDFDGWRERYDEANELNDRIETYEEWYQRQQRIERGERPNDDVFNSDHVSDMIESLFGSTDDRLGVISETHGRMAEWLSYATGVIGSLDGSAGGGGSTGGGGSVGGGGSAGGGGSTGGGGGFWGGGAGVDPADGLIVPANGGSQRLAASSQFR